MRSKGAVLGVAVLTFISVAALVAITAGGSANNDEGQLLASGRPVGPALPTAIIGAGPQFSAGTTLENRVTIVAGSEATISVPTATSIPAHTPVPAPSVTATEANPTPSPVVDVSQTVTGPQPSEQDTAGASIDLSPELRDSLAGLSVNGLMPENFIIMPEEARQNIRRIFSDGQRMGRDPKAFSRVGASIIDTRQFLTKFDTGPYQLGAYDYLQPTIDYFSGSFDWLGVAIHRGLNSWSVSDPIWADKELCQANETIIDCELRLHNPSVLLIVLGTNDTGAAGDFDRNMRTLVDYVIDSGVIPVLVTKADRFEGDDNRNNIVLRQIAADKNIPLWDFDLVATTLPGRGLGDDEVHMTFFDQYDYTLPKAFERGYGLFNLTALMMLHAIWQEIG